MAEVVPLIFVAGGELRVGCLEGAAPAFGEPEEEGGEEEGGYGEFEGYGGVAGAEEAFEGAGDDQEWDRGGDEADGFASGEDDGVSAAEVAGEEDAGAEAETGSAGDEDAGELERAVGGDEGPEAERQAVLMAGDGDDADREAVLDEEKDSEEAGGDAGGEGEKADGDVVGHDGAGGLGFGAEDGFCPHFVVVDGVDHLRAEGGDHVFGAEDGEHGAEEAGGDEEREGEGGVGEEAAEEAGIFVGEIAGDGARRKGAASVDEIMRAGDEPVEVGFEGTGCGIGADGGEVGGGLAVEQAEVAEVLGGEGFEAGGFGLARELFETGPVRFTGVDPTI